MKALCTTARRHCHTSPDFRHGEVNASSRDEALTKMCMSCVSLELPCSGVSHMLD